MQSGEAVPVRGKDRRLAAKERAAANDRSADHRCVYAEMLAARDEAGPFLARARVRRRMKLAASELQRPPTSRAKTTSRARAALENSGYVLPFINLENMAKPVWASRDGRDRSV